MTHTTTIERERGDVPVEIDLEVEYIYHPAHRGRRDSLCGKRNAGPPLEPDEPATVEIESVRDAVSGEDVELTDWEWDRIECEIRCRIAAADF